jgi:hypothetical protein
MSYDKLLLTYLTPCAAGPDRLSSTTRYLTRKRISALMAIIITALLIDMCLSTFSDILKERLISIWGLILFVAIVVIIYGPGQYFVLGFLKYLSKGVRSKAPYLGGLYNMFRIAQYVIAGILFLIIFQIVLTSHYYIVSTIAATTIGYALACIFMSLVSYRFFSWFKSNKDYTVLLYGLAGAMIATSAGGHILTNNSILLEKNPAEINANFRGNFPDIGPITAGVMASVFLYAYVLPLILSFVLMYAGTTLLLRHHSKKLRKIKYWIIICLPLIPFIVGLLPTLLALPSGSFTFYSKSLVTYRLFAVLAGTGGSILIGIAFLTIARALGDFLQRTAMADYLAVTGYGVIMIAISIETPIYQAPYPPFGVAASSSIGLMCYLYSLGIYLSAISVSEDVKLRQSIRKFAIINLDQSRLLDSIGTAHLEQEIVRRVLKIANEQREALADQTGVEPSLTEEEIKNYLADIMEEVKKLPNKQP